MLGTEEARRRGGGAGTVAPGAHIQEVAVEERRADPNTTLK